MYPSTHATGGPAWPGRYVSHHPSSTKPTHRRFEDEGNEPIRCAKPLCHETRWAVGSQSNLASDVTAPDDHERRSSSWHPTPQSGRKPSDGEGREGEETGPGFSAGEGSLPCIALWLFPLLSDRDQVSFVVWFVFSIGKRGVRSWCCMMCMYDALSLRSPRLDGTSIHAL